MVNHICIIFKSSSMFRVNSRIASIMQREKSNQTKGQAIFSLQYWHFVYELWWGKYIIMTYHMWIWQFQIVSFGRNYFMKQQLNCIKLDILLWYKYPSNVISYIVIRNVLLFLKSLLRILLLFNFLS